MAGCIGAGGCDEVRIGDGTAGELMGGMTETELDIGTTGGSIPIPIPPMGTI